MIRALTFLILAALTAVPALSQSLLNPADSTGGKIIAAFEESWSDRTLEPLEGTFTFIKPSLGYNLRYWAGFDLLLPARQVDLTQPVSIGVIFCIEADNGTKSYFYQRHELQPPNLEDPAIKAGMKKLSLHFTGGFFAGPGRYGYRLLIGGKDGRVLRKSGKFKVGESHGATPIPAGKALSMNTPQWTGFPATVGKGRHVTIMMNAAPVYPRRTVARLQPYDRFVLLSALSTLLSQGGFSSAHVIVFDLAGRRILFDEERFDRPAMRRLRRTLEEADLATIDYQTLATGPSPQRLAEEVLMRAAEKRDDQESLVFLGPAWRPSRGQQPINPELKQSLPRIHYLALLPRAFLPQDTINDVVRALKGKIYSIYAPSDFANALQKIAAGG